MICWRLERWRLRSRMSASLFWRLTFAAFLSVLHALMAMIVHPRPNVTTKAMSTPISTKSDTSRSLTSRCKAFNASIAKRSKKTFNWSVDTDFCAGRRNQSSKSATTSPELLIVLTKRFIPLTAWRKTDPKIPLLLSLGDQVANKCSHWQQVDSALREAFSQRLQPGCVAGWVHRDVHNTWRLLFCLLQSLCKWLGWVILNKHILSQVGPEVDQVLRHYVQQGSATILPWQLPLKSQVKVCTPACKSFHWDTFVLLLSSFTTSFPL